MTPDFETLTDDKVKALAVKLYDILTSANLFPGFTDFEDRILLVTQSLVDGDFEIHWFKLGNLTVYSKLVFSPQLQITLRKSLLFLILKVFSSRFNKSIKKGSPIRTADAIALSAFGCSRKTSRGKRKLEIS